MKVLALDIASRTGYAVLEERKNEISLVGSGTIDTTGFISDRMKTLHGHLSKLVLEHNPDVVAIEDLYLGRNANTFRILAYLQAVAYMTVSALISVPIISVSVNRARKTLRIKSKDRKHLKREVTDTVNNFYGLELSSTDGNDVADAVVIGLSALLDRQSHKQFGE